MSLGGWGFSTDAYTHHIFPNGVRDGNRQILAANVAKFIVDKGLDGVDFYWEYPGAQDIPGIEPDSLDSGKNYAEFLKLVRSHLPEGKTMSMALPALYWYLKGFDPITQFDDYIDYYVYMTYDLHGQWDYNNKFVKSDDNNQWVSWLAPDSFNARRQWYDDLHFGGSMDRAVDLNRTYGKNGTGDLEDTGDDWPDLKPCPTIFFPALEGLQSAQQAGAIPDHCVAQMALQTLFVMLQTAYDNYTDVNNGYDEMFGYYVKYIESVVPAILDNDFMWNMSIPKDEGDMPARGYGMDYFDCRFPKEGVWFPCTDWNDHEHGWDESSFHADLRLRDQDGFAKALAKVGLFEDWVTFGDYELTLSPTIRVKGPPIAYKLEFTGWPIKNESMVVQNPKDIVTKGLPNIPKLLSDVETTMLEIMGGSWVGRDPKDAAVAYAPAVFMLQTAVDSMAQAKELGKQEEKKEEEEERKRKENLILLIISVVLMFVPVVGEEAAAGLGMANLARIIAIGGELGNAALATYDTVKDPSSAIVNILGMLFGVGSIAKASRDGKGLGKVAQWRKGMKASEVSSLGKIFENVDDMVQAILGKVCKL